MKINDERRYVLLSVKWCRNGTLVFWGEKTADEEERSFGGYTNDLNHCERYTYDESKNEWHSHYEYNGESLQELMNIDREGTWIVNVDDLDKLGRKSLVYHYWTVW